MTPFATHRGIVVPLDRANIDTDAILPKQFMKSVSRTGFGPHLFDGLRYLDVGESGIDCSIRPLNPEFVLNQPRYSGATILLARRNFGCGSSREHAPWAIQQFGIRTLIGPSFADIFYNNCLKNGVLPVVLPEPIVDGLFKEVLDSPGFALEVDLQEQVIRNVSGRQIGFDIDPLPKEHLLKGLDEIGLTLEIADKIRAFEVERKRSRPWLFEERAAAPPRKA